MVLKKDGKGMISIVDAMIFITLMAIVSVSLFSMLSSENVEEPMAKTICEDLISIELKASDVLDTEDSDVYSISELVASAMSSANTERIMSYISKTMNELVPKMYGYELTVTYGGGMLTFVRENDREISSEYSESVQIVNGMIVQYGLTIR